MWFTPGWLRNWKTIYQRYVGWDRADANANFPGYYDEIVVLDSGSTDRTLEICSKYTDKVSSRTWDGYSAQRNACHDLTSGDWILSLDADERVSPELAAEIKELLNHPDQDMVGYNLPYKVFFADKWLRHGGFYPERHLRLFRRGRGRYGERAVHEALQVDGPCRTLKGHVEHYTYSSVSDFLERMERYAGLSAQEYHRQGRKTGPCRMGGHAFFTFLDMFIFKRGFLDGYEGFLVAGLYSIYTFVKYAKLRELSNPHNS